MTKKLQHIGFSEIRQLMQTNRLPELKRPFVSDDFGMVCDSTLIMNSILQFETPYIMEDVRTGIVLSGSADITINMVDLHLEKGIMAVLPYGSIVCPHFATPDFRIMGMMAKQEFLSYALGVQRPDAMNMFKEYTFVPHTEADTIMAQHFLNNMWEIVKNYGFQRDVIASGIRMYFSFLELLINKNKSNDDFANMHNADTFHRFISLVNEHCCREHNIDFYAQKMCLSSHYLSSQIKDISGSTAKAWIDRAIITQSKALLNSTDLQASQISDRMGFPNASFFSKYFKRITNMTPQQYRETITRV